MGNPRADSANSKATTRQPGARGATLITQPVEDMIVSLHLETPPTDALSALRQGLSQVAASQQRLAVGGARAQNLVPLSPVVMQPHPVYALHLDDLAAGKGLAAAELVSWRYLIVEGDAVSTSAEVR